MHPDQIPDVTLAEWVERRATPIQSLTGRGIDPQLLRKPKKALIYMQNWLETKMHEMKIEKAWKSHLARYGKGHLKIVF